MALFSSKLAPVVALAVVLLTVVGYLAVLGSGNDGLLGTTSPGMATLTVTRPTGGQINIGGYGAEMTLCAPSDSGAATCSSEYETGTGFTLYARPAEGFHFTGWAGSCSGVTPECNVAMDADMAVGASFGR